MPTDHPFLYIESEREGLRIVDHTMESIPLSVSNGTVQTSQASSTSRHVDSTMLQKATANMRNESEILQ
jgi:hypothetical protein